MRVLLAGLGSIGRRHLANIRKLEPAAHITVLRHDPSQGELPAGADCIVHRLNSRLTDSIDIAFVCGPTGMHAELGTTLIEAGIHVFVEKPLALDFADARRMLDASIQRKRMLIVGYNLRFSQSLRALHAALLAGRIGRVLSARTEVGQYLPDWRPGSDYRQTNSARSEFGGGVILELSHEIDYMRWLCGEITAVNAMSARRSDLEIDVDDTAELLLEFAGGQIGNIHMDMTQRSPIRQCRVVGTDGTLTWNGISGETCMYSPDRGWETLVPAGTQDHNAMYLDEVAHVLACIRGDAVPYVDGAAGMRVVELAEAALRAARERRQIAV